MLVTFEGCGFDKRDSVPLHLHDGRLTVPCTQKLPLPGQVGDGETLKILIQYKFCCVCMVVFGLSIIFLDFNIL